MKSARSPQDHILYLGDDEPYVLPRGTLNEFYAETSERLLKKLDNLYPEIIRVLSTHKIFISDLSKAMKAAHQEEERRFEKFLRTQPTNL